MSCKFFIGKFSRSRSHKLTEQPVYIWIPRGCTRYVEFCANSYAPWLVFLEYYNENIHTYSIQNSQNLRNLTHHWPLIIIQEVGPMTECVTLEKFTSRRIPDNEIKFISFSIGSRDRVGGGEGQETWNLCGRLWRPSYLWLICTGPGGGAWHPRHPSGSATEFKGVFCLLCNFEALYLTFLLFSIITSNCWRNTTLNNRLLVIKCINTPYFRL